jgi:hypothetical protein
MVDALPDHIGRVVHRAPVDRREVERHRPHIAVHRAAAGQGARHVGPDQRALSGAPVVARHIRPLAAEDQIGVGRVGRRDAVFLDVHGMPVVERDPPVVRPALHAGAARVLLSRADAIGKRAVGGDVIHRRGVLVVPVAPTSSTIRRHHRSLIGDREDDLRVVRIDPDALVVITTGSAAHRAPGEPAIERPPHHGRRGVDDIRILGIDRDRRQVAAADARQRPHVLLHSSARARAANRLEPMRAAVGRLVEADRSLARRDGGVEDVRIARGDGDVRLQDGRKPVGELSPGRPAVGRLEDPHAGVAESLALDEALLLGPQRRIEDIRVARVEQDFVGAGVVVLEQHLLEGASAVGGSKHTALGVGPVRVTEDGDEEPVGVARIDGDGRDHLAVAQAEMLPGASGVGGLVDPVADGEIRTDDARSSPDVDDARVRRRDPNRADRAGRLVVEQRHPIGAEVRGSPDAAVVEAGVEGIRLAGDASQRTGAPGTRGADVAPAHLAEREVLGSRGRRAGARDGGSEGGENQNGAHERGVCQIAASNRARDIHKMTISSRLARERRRCARL